MSKQWPVGQVKPPRDIRVVPDDDGKYTMTALLEDSAGNVRRVEVNGVEFYNVELNISREPMPFLDRDAEYTPTLLHGYAGFKMKSFGLKEID